MEKKNIYECKYARLSIKSDQNVVKILPVHDIYEMLKEYEIDYFYQEFVFDLKIYRVETEIYIEYNKPTIDAFKKLNYPQPTQEFIQDLHPDAHKFILEIPVEEHALNQKEEFTKFSRARVYLKKPSFWRLLFNKRKGQVEEFIGSRYHKGYFDDSFYEAKYFPKSNIFEFYNERRLILINVSIFIKDHYFIEKQG